MGMLKSEFCDLSYRWWKYFSQIRVVCGGYAPVQQEAQNVSVRQNRASVQSSPAAKRCDGMQLQVSYTNIKDLIWKRTSRQQEKSIGPILVASPLPVSTS
jgi:hypothetical protein